MSSIPKMSSFPTVIETVGWRWEQLAAPDRELDGFWIGVDADGNKWLTKLRGSFYAYREIVFAKLAQTMGWSCQSSVFIRIDVDSAEKLGVQAFEVHAAHWFMNEHCPSACGPRCPFVPIINGVRCNLEYISKSQIKYMMDWPKSVIASYVFGGSEPPDRFFTSDHEFVIIDSEQMFATGPVCFDSDRWLVNDDESPSVLGRDIALQVCRAVSALSRKNISLALDVPASVYIDMLWPIEPLINSSIEFAEIYVHAKLSD